MCLLMSPSSMKSAISDLSALEAVDPGEAKGAVSLTSSGDGCGDAGCGDGAGCADCVCDAACCLEAVPADAILDFLGSLLRIPGK